ncbi:MAG: UDP-N-acetylmuramate:L-alanyl-gamma-D-glutamyl-meso-diaminopimelate ligase [Acidobacteria bacterium]|nr:UDP-N-acetylmuramate:L-alanyl-gamma-D-glutamyl-meso-diaminopimelate ligase [Acidobacteriota bacterium]
MARFHFIGICGTAMGTLALMLRARGHDVQGSDHAMYPPMSEYLARQEVRVFDGFDAAHITPELDVVVIGNAVSRGNPELENVLDRKIRYMSLPEVIREQFLWQAHSIVIAGTHGKTTTTALTGWLLTAGGLDPSVLVGGIARNFDGSYRLGSGRDFVIEGDEYDSAFFDKTAKFLKYLPDVAVIGNLEYDHADIYPDMESLRVAFRRLLTLVPQHGRVLVGIDSAEAAGLIPFARSSVETFGLAAEADWRASAIEAAEGRVRFDVWHRGEPFGRFESPLLGVHNVRNALAGIAVGHAVGLSSDAMEKGLRSFAGVKRRLELRGVVRGVSVFDDFAHHPTAILETLRAVRWSYPGRRVWGVFEPRSATSCRRIFQDDFARAFAESGADEIVIADVFRGTLPPDQRLSVEDLVAAVTTAGVHARHVSTAARIAETIAEEARDGDLVIVMSNGGFDGLHARLLEALAR